jgi:hypothetical protein
MNVVNPNAYYEGSIDFTEYISKVYRQKNKNNGNEGIEREQNEIENEKWGRNMHGNMNGSRTKD